MISKRAPLEIYIFPCLRKYPARRTAWDDGSEATERGEGLGGGAFPGQGKFCIWSPKKREFRMHIFGQRLLEYDFLQIAWGQDDTIEL